MITTDNSAKVFARKLVKQFYADHDKLIEINRPHGTISINLAKELGELRQVYLKRVSPDITRSTMYLNRAIVEIVLRTPKDKKR